MSKGWHWTAATSFYKASFYRKLQRHVKTLRPTPGCSQAVCLAIVSPQLFLVTEALANYLAFHPARSQAGHQNVGHLLGLFLRAAGKDIQD